MARGNRHWLWGLLLLALLVGLMRLTGLAAGQPPRAASDQLLRDLSGVWRNTATGDRLILNLTGDPKIFRSAGDGGYAYPARVEATIPESYTAILAVQQSGPAAPAQHRYVLVLVGSGHSRQLLLTLPDATTRTYAWERALSGREASQGPTRFVTPPAPAARPSVAASPTLPAPSTAPATAALPAPAPAAPIPPVPAPQAPPTPAPQVAAPADPGQEKAPAPPKEKAAAPSKENVEPPAAPAKPAPAAPAKPAPAAPENATGCENIRSPHRRSLCESPEFAQADAALNATFRRVMAALSPQERQALQKEEDAWVRRKQATCGADTDCMLAMTRARTHELARRTP